MGKYKVYLNARKTAIVNIFPKVGGKFTKFFSDVNKLESFLGRLNRAGYTTV